MQKRIKKKLQLTLKKSNCQKLLDPIKKKRKEWLITFLKRQNAKKE